MYVGECWVFHIVAMGQCWVPYLYECMLVNVGCFHIVTMGYPTCVWVYVSECERWVFHIVAMQVLLHTLPVYAGSSHAWLV